MSGELACDLTASEVCERLAPVTGIPAGENGFLYAAVAVEPATGDVRVATNADNQEVIWLLRKALEGLDR